MNDDFSAIVDPDFDGRIIKDFLKKRLGFSSSLITKVKYGGVSVNARVVRMREVLHTGDVVTVRFPEEKSENIEPIPYSLSVIYEDEDILAVNKPTNMPIHPSRGNHLVTLANAVAYYFNSSFVFRAIGRLDRDTSGIVVIAKNAYAATRLYSDMKNGEFEKHYLALLSRTPCERHGFIDAPIERESEGSIKRTIRADGKTAKTEYTVTEILPDGRAWADIRLYTGRTHQIRVHMAHVGAPLYNDFLYGESVCEGSYILHCSRLIFPHPRTREKIELYASLPTHNI